MTSPVDPERDRLLEARAARLAASLLADSSHYDTRHDRHRRTRVAALLDDPAGIAFLLGLTDEVVRIHSPQRAARRFADLVAEHGVPVSVGGFDRLALRAGAASARYLPNFLMPLVVARLRREFAGVIVPAEPIASAEHIE